MAQTPKEEQIIIGIDAEWVYDPERKLNRVLSYQYAGRTAKGEWSGIIYTDGPLQSDRLKFGSIVGKAIEHGREIGAIGRIWPKAVYVAAHFSRADLSACLDFDRIKSKFDSVGKTFVTLSKPLPVRYNDASNNAHDLSVSLVDTMLLTPNGAALVVLGEMYGLPKVELSPGMIERMDILLETNRDLYERYAIRDAEISALHAWKMAEFVHEHFGEREPPVTLGSLAVKHVKAIWDQNGIDRHAVLGTQGVKEKKFNRKLGRSTTINRTVSIPTVYEHEALATECYHGGRNEAYEFGFTGIDMWTDFDLAGAYTTAMAAIRIPDYAATRVNYNPADYKADVLGLARISFEFPKETRFPCLPVRTDNGLVFPLQGETYVASPEIELALGMGAEIHIQYGVIIPWASEVRPFEVFSKSIRDHRAEHDKGSIIERTWKEIGNSLYGKLAQGLHEKRVFDSRSGDMETLGPSAITQPALAAYTTSLVRAVLGEILHRIPLHRTVVSATTDGFLTNAQYEEIDLSGPLCRMFGDLREQISGNPTILEVKHLAVQLLCWKTRGQATVEVTGQGLSPVIAKAGIKPPTSVAEDAARAWDHPFDLDPPSDLRERAANDWIVNLFLDRNADTTVPVSNLISMRDMFDDDDEPTDLVTKESERRINMEYDWKREMVPLPDQAPLLTEAYPHFRATSRPWQTVADFAQTRTRFDQWRTQRRGVLKASMDWASWSEFRVLGTVATKGMNATKEGLMGKVRRTVLRAYTRGQWGLPGGGYEAFSTYLTEAGYPTSVDDLKNAKRKSADLVEVAFPATREVMTFIRLMLLRYPAFEWTRLIQVEVHNSVKAEL